jgi:hypothetical protein
MASTDTIDVMVERLETAREGERAYYVRTFLKDGSPFDMVVMLRGGRVDELRVFVRGRKAVFKGREARRRIKPVLGALELFFLFAEESYQERVAMVG